MKIGIISILWQQYLQKMFALYHSFSWTMFKYNNLLRNSINSSARTLKIHGFQLFIWYKRTPTFHHCAIILVALEPWILTLLSLYQRGLNRGSSTLNNGAYPFVRLEGLRIRFCSNRHVLPFAFFSSYTADDSDFCIVVRAQLPNENKQKRTWLVVSDT